MLFGLFSSRCLRKSQSLVAVRFPDNLSDFSQKLSELASMNELLLKVRNLEKRFGGVVVAHDVHFDLVRDDLVCIIGPNGAGKTTLINMLSGMIKPDSGSIFFEGRNIIGLPLYKYARIGIVRKFQIPTLFPRMSPRENLEVAQLGVGIKSPSSDVDAVLDLIGLLKIADTQIAGALPHGQKQWLEIGMTLICQPKLLILDEPTAGMSIDETDKTAKIIKSLKSRCSIIVIEHNMRCVRSLNTRTIVLHRGEIISEGTFSEVENDPRVRNVYLGRQ